jgi:hypothetical protein
VDESFQFAEATHIYSVQRRGKTVEIPGVTRILDTSGLVNYRFVRPDILERKSRLGKEIHRVTVLYDKGTLDFDSVDPRVLRGWISGDKRDSSRSFASIDASRKRMAFGTG